MPPEFERKLEEFAKQFEEQSKRIEQVEQKLAAAEREIERKDQIIAALQKRLFGSQSERIDPDQYQLEFGEEVLGKPEPPTPCESEGDPEAEDGERRNAEPRHRKQDLFPRNLPVLIEEVSVPEEVAADPDAFKEIGEEYHDELEAVRSSLYWRRKVRKKYKSKEDRSRSPLMNPAPEPSIPGTMCGPNLLAMILADSRSEAETDDPEGRPKGGEAINYVDHLPHYRQADRFLRQHGVELTSQTLNGWTHAAAAHLAPIGRAILRELREAEILQIDESPGDYLAPGTGSTGQGYLWYYRDAEKGTVYCDWNLGRGHDCLLEILGLDEESGLARFSGTIQCDGYSAYQALVRRYGGIRLAGCLAHIRRKYYEAREQDPEVVMPILKTIAHLYRIEGWLRQANAPPDCRLLVRAGQARPVVEELKERIRNEREKHLPRSKLGEAITYALGQWEEFVRYLEDGRSEIDNNLIENAIRPAKLGLKNFLFFGSAEAGENSALLYTLVANCKVQGIDAERYFAEVLRRLPAEASDEQAAGLTPAKLADEIRAGQPRPAGREVDADAA